MESCPQRLEIQLTLSHQGISMDFSLKIMTQFRVSILCQLCRNPFPTYKARATGLFDRPAETVFFLTDIAAWRNSGRTFGQTNLSGRMDSTRLVDGQPRGCTILPTATSA